MLGGYIGIKFQALRVSVRSYKTKQENKKPGKLQFTGDRLPGFVTYYILQAGCLAAFKVKDEARNSHRLLNKNNKLINR